MCHVCLLPTCPQSQRVRIECCFVWERPLERGNGKVFERVSGDKCIYSFGLFAFCGMFDGNTLALGVWFSEALLKVLLALCLVVEQLLSESSF